jgi:hypothetical protein
MRYFGLVQASARCGLGLGPTFLPVCIVRLVGSTGDPLAPLNSSGKYEFTSGLLCGNSLTAKKASIRSFMIVLPLKKGFDHN